MGKFNKTLNNGLRIIFTLTIALFFSLSAYAIENNQVNHPLFGIIIPLPEESLFLKKNISHEKNLNINGITYHIGTINHKNIVFVNCGLGKVNSAIVATRLIRDFHPDLILMAGSSGSISPYLKKFDVIVGKKVANVDMGELTKNGPQFKFDGGLYNPQINATLPITFNLSDKLVKLINQLTQSNNKDFSRIVLGKIATSDALPNPPSQVSLLREDGFDVIEMEGASLMQVCWLFKTPCMVIRGVSNNMSEPITKKDITVSAEKASKILINVILNYTS
ncbi:MAG: 5'-methylthioadenosine/S-adenosylhomocysteine nucleosidase [Legionellales bacterium]|nr:5'-methylthioadenosine/S-adenosylhomocysteine nucleosidase [Legionellales bacterium]